MGKLGIFYANETSICLHIRNKGEVGRSNMFKSSSDCLTDRSNVLRLLLIIFVICYLSHTVLSVPCSLVVTCWERADLLAHLYVMFSCVFVTFPYGVLRHCVI